MTVTSHSDYVLIPDTEYFDLDKTLDCGQCFRFERMEDGGWQGVALGRRLRMYQSEKGICIYGITKSQFENEGFYDYFDLGRSYGEINRVLYSDPVLRPMISEGSGIRILRQPPFETLVSFIISTSNNIPRIKQIIDRLCKQFGRRAKDGFGEYYTFPDCGILSELGLDQLAAIRAGYRDKYILDCAKKVAGGEVDLKAVKQMEYPDAVKELTKIKGVGVKVADCVLLFAYGKLCAFPRDVWIKRALEKLYPDDGGKALMQSQYAGIAQQYMYFWARNNHITTL